MTLAQSRTTTGRKTVDEEGKLYVKTVGLIIIIFYQAIRNSVPSCRTFMCGVRNWWWPEDGSNCLVDGIMTTHENLALLLTIGSCMEGKLTSHFHSF